MRRFLIGAAITLVLGAGGQAQASLITFTGSDNSVTSLAQMTNSVAAETAFSAAVPSASIINFEVPVPSGVIVSGGLITNDPNATQANCGSLCGFNTTPGGQFFYLLTGGTGTFTFSTPINAFGMYITGLQTDLVPQETLTFSDGSQQTINTPSATGGGGAFIGFTDFGQSIVSVSYNATSDIVSLDDVQFSSATPLPAALPLFATGLGGLGLLSWRRKRKAVA
jgi:hypothetical protein